MGWGMQQSLISLPGCHRLIGWNWAHPPNVREKEGTAPPPNPHPWPFGWEKGVASGPFGPPAIYQNLLAGLFSIQLPGLPRQSVSSPQGPGGRGHYWLPALLLLVSVFNFHICLYNFSWSVGLALIYKAGFQWLFAELLHKRQDASWPHPHIVPPSQPPPQAKSLSLISGSQLLLPELQWGLSWPQQWKECLISLRKCLNHPKCLYCPLLDSGIITSKWWNLGRPVDGSRLTLLIQSINFC